MDKPSESLTKAQLVELVNNTLDAAYDAGTEFDPDDEDGGRMSKMERRYISLRDELLSVIDRLPNKTLKI